jgi:hypothetical protein
VIIGCDPHARSRTCEGTPLETLPREERIRRRAYERYIREGNQSSSELDDWLQAEEEIRSAQEQTIAEV